MLIDVIHGETMAFLGVVSSCDGSLSLVWDQAMAADEASDRSWARGSDPSESGKLLISRKFTFDQKG
jgi:hypothetical protein